ncbi:MAG: TonB-dependent receptor [Sphingopyxis sp.]
MFAVCTPVQGFAQEAAAPPVAEDQVGNDDIIVTATRREETLQTVPVSVTALTGKAIEQRGITNIDNLASSVPNLAVRPAAASKSTAIISMRGQVQRENLPTVDPSVGVYVDDIYLARSYSALSELLDVERVEVLRGPQGTLFGRNTIGGAIRVIARKPKVDEGLTGSFYAGYGNYDRLEMGGAVTIPIVADRLALRYAGNIRSHDGYTKTTLVTEPYTGPASIRRVIDTNDESVTSHRLSVAWHPSDTTRIDASYYLFREKSNGVLVANLFGDISNTTLTTPRVTTQFNSPQRDESFYAALSNVTPFSKSRADIMQATIAQDLSEDITLKLIGSYVKGSNRSSTNADGVVSESVTLVQFEPNLSQGQKQYTGEIQLAGSSFDGVLDWIGGLYYFEEDAYDFSPGNSRTLGSRANAITFDGSVNNKSKSGYLSLTFHPTDRLTFRAGGRYTEDTKGILGQNRNVNTGICVYTAGPGIITSTTPNGPCELRRTDKFDYWIYDVGADYKVTDDIFVYVKTGNGFRSGGQQLRSVNTLSSLPFDPDKVVNYEAGFKVKLFDMLTVNAAAYHVDYSNVQQSLILSPPNTPTTTTANVNQGSANVEGFEVETFFTPVKGLRLEASVGHNDFDFKDPTIVQILSPRWKWAVGGSYTQEIGTSKLTGQVNFDHSGAFYGTPNPLTPGALVSGSDLLSARLALQLDNGLELSLWGRNLTKDEYFVSATFSGNVAGGVVGNPRTYGMTARFSF